MGLISFLLISKPLYSSSCCLPLVMTNGSQQEQAGWQQEEWGLQPSLDIEDTDDAHRSPPVSVPGVGKCPQSQAP